MQKEKQVKSYTRRTKSGKTVVVHAYKAKYDAAEEMKKALAKKSGAGKELIKKQQAATDAPLGFSAEEFKQWYHWDLVDDPKNKAALKVEKALKKSMGTKVYKKFFDEVTDGYSARGHNKALKSLESSLSTPKKETSTKGQKGEPSKKTGDTSKPTSAKEMKVQKRAEASAPKSVKSIESKLAEMTHLAGNDAKQAVKLLKEAGYRRKKVTYTANDGNREDWALISPDGHRVYMTRGGNTMLMKFPGITSAKDTKKSEKPLTYGQAFKRAKDNFKKRKAAAKYEKPTDIKTLQSKGWQLHGRELPSLRSKKTQEAFLVSPDGKKMYRLSAAINPIGRGMIPMWRLNKNAELLDTTTAIRRKFEK